MNIKRKIKKVFILKFLTSFILSDKYYYWYYYLIFFRRKFSYRNPRGFNAKIQWLKVNYRDKRLTLLSDKYEVRNYVSEKIGDQFLVPIIDVFSSTSEIDWNKLPERFVMKATHASGWNIICNSKKDLNKSKEIRKINKWFKRNYYYQTREWQYKNIPPRIICEENLVTKDTADLIEIKIFCYHGEPHFIVAYPFKSSLRTIYNIQWKIIDGETDFKKGAEIEKPENLEKILKLASVLSDGFPFVRVDFMIKNDQIYFGEMSFTPKCGFLNFNPRNLDLMFGKPLKVPN